MLKKVNNERFTKTIRSKYPDFELEELDKESKERKKELKSEYRNS
jgi:hypothetical protein